MNHKLWKKETIHHKLSKKEKKRTLSDASHARRPPRASDGKGRRGRRGEEEERGKEEEGEGIGSDLI